MEIMVVGDVHGSFDRLVKYQKEQDPDLCLQVGDLEAVRDEDDLDELTGPEKYKEIKRFPPYWTGEKSIPVETLFIGGNHEPWSFLHRHDPTRGK
jgi:lariat debranching enzyme